MHGGVVVVEVSDPVEVVIDVVLVLVVVVDVDVAVVAVVEVVVVAVVELGTRVAIDPNRSDLMNFMQYPNDPTFSGLVHSVFILFASFDASVIFLQSFSGFRSPHCTKELSF